MGRQKDPFHRHGHSQNGGKGEYEDEYDVYEDDLEYDEDVENDEYEVEDMQDDVYEKESNIPRRRSARSLPPFPSNARNKYPHTSRTRRMPGSTTPRPRIRPTQTTRSKRQTVLPDEPQPPSRRSTGSYQRVAQPRTRSDDFPRRPASARVVPSQPRKHRVWPIFFVGCGAGAVSLVLAAAIFVLIEIHSIQNGGVNIPGTSNTGKPYSQKISKIAPLSTLSQLVVCDPAGNVSLSVNSNATSATVETTETVQAGNQNDANQAFGQITVDVQPLNSVQQDLTCQTLQASNTPASNKTPTATDNTVLIVKVTFATNLTGQTPKADVAITLPESAVQLQQGPTNTFISMEDHQGNINVDGINGIMKIHDSAGDITVKNGALVDGSRLETEGNLTFDGFPWQKPVAPNKQANLFFGGEYLINLTLPETTPATIDATANIRAGKITSDFSINVVNNQDGSHVYHGPFNPATAADEQTAPKLTLLASSGNIAIHKK